MRTWGWKIRLQGCPQPESPKDLDKHNHPPWNDNGLHIVGITYPLMMMQRWRKRIIRNMASG